MTEIVQYRKSTLHEELAKFDRFSHAVTVIQEQHRLAHDGMFFTATGKQLAWATGTSKSFLIDVPAGVYPHIQVMNLTFGSGDIDFIASELVVTSADGTPIVSQNVNRNSQNTPGMLLYAEPTVTDAGDNLFTLWTPDAGKATGVSGVGQASEWILKPSTKYLIVITNNSGAPIDWSYEFSWYESGYID